MLQVWVYRLKAIIQGKLVLSACLGFILALGLSYYFIDGNLGSSSTKKSKVIGSQPAAEVVIGNQDSRKIVVDISGAVQKPGIYKLEGTPRVGDAVQAAGGIDKNASLEYVSKNLNLADPLEDSDKIYIPFEWDLYTEEKYDIKPLVVNSAPVGKTNTKLPTQGSSTYASGSSNNLNPSSPASSQKIDVNEATSAVLDELPGIGPAYAQRIIDNRPYKDYSELSSKSGVPKSTLDKIKGFFSF